MVYPGYQRSGEGASGQAQHKKCGVGGVQSALGLIGLITGPVVWHTANTLSFKTNGYNFKSGAQAT